MSYVGEEDVFLDQESSHFKTQEYEVIEVFGIEVKWLKIKKFGMYDTDYRLMIVWVF